jgi:Tfp pilus assembly PilM family ATPase
MPYVLAVDWDQNEARYVLGSLSSRKVRVRALGAQDLPADADGGVPDEAFGRWINDVLKKHKVHSCRMLVAVPRSSVEMLSLTVPPTTDRELPELVANQAMQESSTISEDTLLDFLPGAAEPGAPRRVTVAALQQEELQRVRHRCQAARPKLKRVVLRPLASLSLFRRLAPDRNAACLVLSRVGTEVDLNVVQRGRLILTRTVRLPDDASDEDVSDRLLAEIQRTLLVTPREVLGDQTLEHVYVIGGQADHASLIEEIEQQMSLAAEVLDPFAATGVLEARIPPHRERFAPLLGMLLDEAVGTHPLDFLHPRRSPRKIPPWRIAAAAGGILAIVALVLGIYVWGELSEVREENAALRARLRELNETARKAVQQRDRIEAIAGWRARDVQWLDELRDLSVRFPPPRDAVLMRMTMRPAQAQGGVIDLQGLVRDPNIVVNMERQVRDRFRNVRSRRIQQRALEDDYTWLFETSVSVFPRRPDQYLAPPPADLEPSPGLESAPLAAAEGDKENIP